MKKRTSLGIVRISIGVEVARFVRVKAHKRICNGKVVRVRRYYRRY